MVLTIRKILIKEILMKKQDLIKLAIVGMMVTASSLSAQGTIQPEPNSDDEKGNGHYNKCYSIHDDTNPIPEPTPND